MNAIYLRLRVAVIAVAAGQFLFSPAPSAFAQSEPPADEQGLGEQAPPDEVALEEPEPLEEEAFEDEEPPDEGGFSGEDIYQQEARSQNLASGIAQDGDSADEGRTAGGVGVELGVYAGDEPGASVFVLSPGLSGWLGLGRGWRLTVDWGFAFQNYTPEVGDGSGTLVLGSPVLQARRVLHEGRTRIGFGFGVTLPVATLPDENDIHFLDQATTYELASAMRGTWNPWMWVPEHVTMVIPVEAEMLTEGHLLVGGETALAIAIPSGDYKNDRAEIFIQFAGKIGFNFDEVDIGLRLRGVAVPTFKGDKFQMSIEPFAHLDLGDGYLDAALTANLDLPHGVFGSGADIWGLFLGGGLVF